MIGAVALEGLPEVGAGDDLAALIVAHGPAPLQAADIVVIAHKVVSKAEGRTRALPDVVPSDRAHSLATELGKDPRHVQVVLDESRQILRAAHGVLICVTHHGFVCANAGVDASNASVPDTVILLPADPDASARRLRADLNQLTGTSPAVLITDSFGRAWRHGRGRTDAHGRVLKATWIAVADELAAAADLARTKDGRQPVVIVHGAGRHVTAEDGPGAAALLRPEAEDLFR
jgi:coenzyme F420-0:L-glutamate ligase/coenzyme F420-1:gamma-L-glutamate ligase